MSKSATITIYKSAVLADIDAQTFKRVDGILAKEEEQVRNALSSASEEMLDKHILHRHMENRDADIRKRLTFCLVGDQEESLSASNIMEIESPTFTYNLNVPDGYDSQRLKVLAKKIHEYIVQGSICDWYATQNMQGNVKDSDLEEMEDEIAAMLRVSYIKRPLQPFGPRN